MQTECPNCHTLFRITSAQLEMADGMVRCGFCKEVFDARVVNDFHDNKYQLDAFEEMQSSAADNNEPDHAAFFSGEANEIVSDDLRAESITRPCSTLATAAWSLGILLLIIGLAAEFIWFHHPELLQNTRLKPLSSALCRLTDCSHLQLRDPSQIEMISRNVYTHPNAKNALMVSTTMVNHASFAQPYPDVQIDFSDVRGELIASRRFTPDEYLRTETEKLQLLPSGNAITFGLEIKDPGKDAITYEFSFH
ncbi:MAG: DUF3426 domain-containing protein [Gammaproteobacteria bacterium]|jgi:predicted Zn finger-like uncharacterized protein